MCLPFPVPAPQFLRLMNAINIQFCRLPPDRSTSTLLCLWGGMHRASRKGWFNAPMLAAHEVRHNTAQSVFRLIVASALPTDRHMYHRAVPCPELSSTQIAK